MGFHAPVATRNLEILFENYSSNLVIDSVFNRINSSPTAQEVCHCVVSHATYTKRLKFCEICYFTMALNALRLQSLAMFDTH
jgi:hypothetical protein